MAGDCLGDDLALAHGTMGEHRLAGHVADRVDRRIARPAALVDLESSQPSPRRLTTTVLDRLKARDAKGLKTTVYNATNPRAAIAAVAADVVLLAANDDPLAREILAAASVELAALAQDAAHQLGFAATEFPLAMAGGVLVASEFLRACVERELKTLHLNCWNYNSKAKSEQRLAISFTAIVRSRMKN